MLEGRFFMTNIEEIKKILELIEDFQNLGEQQKVQEGVKELFIKVSELNEQVNPNPKFNF